MGTTANSLMRESKAVKRNYCGSAVAADGVDAWLGVFATGAVVFDVGGTDVAFGGSGTVVIALSGFSR